MMSAVSKKRESSRSSPGIGSHPILAKTIDIDLGIFSVPKTVPKTFPKTVELGPVEAPSLGFCLT